MERGAAPEPIDLDTVFGPDLGPKPDFEYIRKLREEKEIVLQAKEFCDETGLDEFTHEESGIIVRRRYSLNRWVYLTTERSYTPQDLVPQEPVIRHTNGH